MKKGKFKLFSYIVEDALIFYKSYNTLSKFIAFSVIKLQSEFIPFKNLNHLLNRSLISFYSIQFDILADNANKYIILNFEDPEKENILKLFHIVFQELTEIKCGLRFLKKANLEQIFFLDKLRINQLKNNRILKDSNELVLKIDKKKLSYYIYEISLDKIKKQRNFVRNLKNLLKDLNHFGYLIFNFQLNKYKKVKINPYFINYRKTNKNQTDLCQKVNSFYKASILENKPHMIKIIPQIIWRLPISNVSYLYNEDVLIFDNFYLKNSKLNEKIYLNIFKNQLKKKSIEYVKIDNNSILINNRIIFLVYKSINFKSVLDIFKKYYNKDYYIIISIIENKEYKKIMSIDKINSLKNLQILKFDEILDQKLENNLEL